jgi:hypothetical protein
VSIQAFQQNFQQTRPLVDPKTGVLTVDGQYLLLALWNRTGQGSGIVPVVSPPLTATGSGQGDALGLVADWNDVESVPGTSGVVMPILKPGNDITVYNGSGNSLNVYPFSGARIDIAAVNAAISMAPGELRYFQCWSTTQMRTAYHT